MSGEKLYVDLPPFTGRNVPVTEIAKAMHKDAQYVRDLVLERFKGVKEVPIFDIGTTIGCHTGTGTVALFFTSSDEREDSQ